MKHFLDVSSHIKDHEKALVNLLVAKKNHTENCLDGY